MSDRESVSAEGIVARVEGSLARILLDRPRTLNALDLGMVEQMTRLLEDWRTGGVRAVTIESSTPGVFCAGGDIRRIRQNTLDERLDDSDEFFATEYRLNAMLASYPVPIIALVDGVCMGGGLGVSAHGPFRVVTEHALLAMPETAIGFFPDIGASFFLPRLAGAVGTYLGLTGARLRAADALATGLATHHISSDRLASLVNGLSAGDWPIDRLLRELATTPDGESDIAAHRDVIDRVFTAASIPEMFRRLDEESDDWADSVRITLAQVSPQSLELTLDLLLWGRQRTLAQCLEAERAAAQHVVRSHDFVEGVRAALVDKDRAPVWGPLTTTD